MRAGDRIEVTGVLPNDPAPLDVGTRGVVRDVNYYNRTRDHVDMQISVDWDNGRTLMLLADDPWRIVREAGTMNDLESPTELDEVPVKGVIVDRNHQIWQKVEEGVWQTIGDDRHYDNSAIRLSARTLY